MLGALAGLDDDEPGGARLELGSCAGSVGSVLPGMCTVGSWAGGQDGAHGDAEPDRSGRPAGDTRTTGLHAALLG